MVLLESKLLAIIQDYTFLKISVGKKMSLITEGIMNKAQEGNRLSMLVSIPEILITILETTKGSTTVFMVEATGEEEVMAEVAMVATA